MASDPSPSVGIHTTRERGGTALFNGKGEKTLLETGNPPKCLRGRLDPHDQPHDLEELAGKSGRARPMITASPAGFFSPTVPLLACPQPLRRQALHYIEADSMRPWILGGFLPDYLVHINCATPSRLLKNVRL